MQYGWRKSTPSFSILGNFQGCGPETFGHYRGYSDELFWAVTDAILTLSVDVAKFILQSAHISSSPQSQNGERWESGENS